MTEPTDELQEGPVAPNFMYNDSVLLDSGAHNHSSLNAAPSDPAALYDNLTHLPNTFKKDDYGVPLLQMEASSGYTVTLRVLLPLWLLTKVRLLPRSVKLLLTLVPWHN